MIVSALIFLVGLALLLWGAEVLVRGASSLARGWGVTPLIIGLTIVSFGTSAPELAISVASAVNGKGELAIGNVVGSNIANVLLILGTAAAMTSMAVQRQLVRLDVPIMIASAALAYLFARDGTLERWEGGVLFSLALLYTWVLFRLSKQGKAPPIEAEEEQLKERPLWQNLGLIGIGIVMLMLGSKWLVQGASDIAAAFGVSELVIGLTVVAIGTSAPELATTVMAVRKNEGDLAVGNVIGSNIFNIFVVLGATILVSPNALAVPSAALAFDFPVMVLTLATCMPLLYAGYRIFRWEGWVFLAYYAAYVTYLLLQSSHHDALPAFARVLGWFAMPLNLLIIVGLAANFFIRRRLEERAQRRGSG